MRMQANALDETGVAVASIEANEGIYGRNQQRRNKIGRGTRDSTSPSKFV